MLLLQDTLDLIPVFDPTDDQRPRYPPHFSTECAPRALVQDHVILELSVHFWVTLHHVRACSVTSIMPDSVTLWAVTHQAPLSMGVCRQEYWSGLPCSPSGDLPSPGIEPASSASPAVQVDCLLTESLGKPHHWPKQVTWTVLISVDYSCVIFPKGVWLASLPGYTVCTRDIQLLIFM